MSELYVLGGAELADDARAKFFGGRAAGAFDGPGERAGRVIAEVKGDLLDWSCGAGNEDGCNALDESFFAEFAESFSGGDEDGSLDGALADAQCTRKVSQQAVRSALQVEQDCVQEGIVFV